MTIPNLTSKGDLPQGLHQATLDEVIVRFGSSSDARKALTTHLLRIYNLVDATNKLERFIIFGSYITEKIAPDDIDLFLVMTEEFNIDDYTGETRDLFSHRRAQHLFRASVFWVSKVMSLESIDNLIEGWQTKRDQTKRGIVEVIK